MSIRIELRIPPNDPTYTRLSALTGLTTPTDIHNLVWSVCAQKLADRLANFNLDDKCVNTDKS